MWQEEAQHVAGQTRGFFPLSSFQGWSFPNPGAYLVWQEEAKRVAEQMRALEETRARMTADLGAREAALAQREDAAVAAARKREDDLRRRSAQDEQVSLLAS